MTTPQPKEYIITEEYIDKLDIWLSEHGIDELQRMQIHSRLTLQPVEENHCDKCDHWDMCEGCPYTDERSRPHTQPPASEHIHLNTQPEGCDCGDCVRYGKEECPFPGSNPTIYICHSFLLNIKEHDATIRNATLDELKESIGEDLLEDFSEDLFIYHRDLLFHIESLRTTTASTNSEATDL